MRALCKACGAAHDEVERPFCSDECYRRISNDGFEVGQLVRHRRTGDIEMVAYINRKERSIWFATKDGSRPRGDFGGDPADKAEPWEDWVTIAEPE